MASPVLTDAASSPVLSDKASSTLLLISVLDRYGAQTWNLRVVGFVTAVLLGTVRYFLGKKGGVDWYSLIHSAVTGIGAVLCVYLDFFWAESMTGVPEPLHSVQCGGALTSLHRILPAVTMGFSLFDFADGCTMGPDFLLHGLATLTIMSYFCEHALSHMITPMLLMEVSSIFLTLVRAEFFPTKVLYAVQLSFAITFTICRVVLVPYVWTILILTLYKEKDRPQTKDCFPDFFLEVVLVFGLFFHTLNFYWFVKIVKKMKRKLTGIEKIDENNDITSKDFKKKK